MDVLIVVTRFPAPFSKGDQQRAWTWATQLAKHHRVTVVTSGAAPDDDAVARLRAVATLVHVPSGPLPRAVSAMASMARGRSAQVGWMLPGRAWREVRERATGSDVVLAMTARAVRGRLAAPLVIDHVDARSLNMRRRAGGPEALPVRLAARLEAWGLARWERDLEAMASGAIITSAEDREALGWTRDVAVMPVALDELHPPPEGPRDIDLVLTGNMRYPPNRRAAERFASEIVPLVRRSRPDVRAVVVGRSASALPLPGVEIASDVPDVASYLERSKIALAPLEGGTGTPYKVLEAAAAGAAVVVDPWVERAFGASGIAAATTEEYAKRILAMLDDEHARREAVRAMMAVVERHTAVVLGRELDALLTAATQDRRSRTLA